MINIIKTPSSDITVSPKEVAVYLGYYSAKIDAETEKLIAGCTEEFLKAAEKCKKAGARLDEAHYKRPFPDCPDGLEEYYNCKEIYFISFSENLDDLSDGRIVETMRSTYKAFSPMYKFLLGVSDEYFSKEE